MNELKPCPFCGGEAQYIDEVELNYCYVFCKNCFAQTGQYVLDAEDKAITAWNKRTEGK